MPKEINEFCDLNDLSVVSMFRQFVVTFTIIYSQLTTDILQSTPVSSQGSLITLIITGQPLEIILPFRKNKLYYIKIYLVSFNKIFESLINNFYSGEIFLDLVFCFLFFCFVLGIPSFINL